MAFVADEVINFRESLTKDQREVFDRIWYERREDAYKAGIGEGLRKLCAYIRLWPGPGILKSALVRWFSEIAPDAGIEDKHVGYQPQFLKEWNYYEC